MAELADDWPSLAPIRTACTTSSSISSSCHSLNPSGSYPLSHTHTFQSPPSSSPSSSHALSLLQRSTSSSAKSLGLLSKCLPPRPTMINSGSPVFGLKSSSPAAGSTRRSVQHGGDSGTSRSYASFPGAKGTICSTTSAVQVAAAAAATAVSTHSGPLQSNACRNYLVGTHTFTMIPAAVVGKKKPPEYLSDEPTSPEVTCMGKVRRSKSSACAWDALVDGSEKCRTKKRAQRKQTARNHHEARGDLDSDLQLAASIPRPLSMHSFDGIRTSTWRKIISFFDNIRDLRTPAHLQRKFRQDHLIIDLELLRRNARRFAGRASPSNKHQIDEKQTEANVGKGGILYICQSGEEGEGEERCDVEIVRENGAMDDCTDSHCAPLHSSNSCLLSMMNKSGSSKVFHDDDDGDDNTSNDDNASGCIRAHLTPPHSHTTRDPGDPTSPHATHRIQSSNKKQAARFSYLEREKCF